MGTSGPRITEHLVICSKCGTIRTRTNVFCLACGSTNVAGTIAPQNPLHAYLLTMMQYQAPYVAVLLMERRAEERTPIFLKDAAEVAGAATRWTILRARKALDQQRQLTSRELVEERGESKKEFLP